MKELQRYIYNRKTYFVDYRLREFRSDTPLIEWVEFDSEKGDYILCKMLKDKVLDISKYFDHINY